MTARMAVGVLAQRGERGDGDGGRGVAGDRLEDDGARLDAGALEFFLHQEAVIVVAQQDGRHEARVRLAAAAASRRGSWRSGRRRSE